MRNCKWLAVLVCAAMALVFATASYGQAPQVVGAGSSALFPTVAIGAVNADPITSAAAPCGTNFWSGGTSLASGIDPRKDGSTQVPAEPGNLWVAWDNDTAPTKVCAYLSVDSIVGQRLFFAQGPGVTGNATLSISAAAKETLGANKVSFVLDTLVCTAGAATTATATVSSIVDPAGTATFTATAPLGASFTVGTVVRVTGTTNFNGAFVIATSTAPGGTTFTFAHAAAATENAGTGSIGSTVSVASIVDAAGTATFTATGALPAGFANGALVSISGTTNFNGTFTIANTTAPAGTTFTFTHAAAATENAGSGEVAPNCPGIPPAVYTLINGAHFNVAFTDIRPEDGQYAYHRAACALIPGDLTKACMGYGPEGHIGTAVLDSYFAASAQVVTYAISGTDPLTGVAIPGFTTIPIGGAPLVVFVNTSDASAAGLGNAAFTNVPSQVLSQYYNGLAGGTADMNPAVLPANVLIHIVEREPLSGTYNAFEWTAIRFASDNRVRSQEDGNTGFGSNCFIPPAAPVTCGNPMWVPGADTATRARAIGTGNMVKAVSAGNAFISPSNSLGYAFFSLGTFGGVANIKYLNLDGNDPIYANGANATPGAFPACTGFFNATPAFSCGAPGLPTFANLQAGNYRAWSVLRAVTATAVPAGVTALLQAAQDQASPGVNHIADFVPFHYCANPGCSSFTQGLRVFKSHYGLSGFAGSNGNVSGSTEAGGDMAGATFTIQAELDYNNFIGVGSELINYFN